MDPSALGPLGFRSDIKDIGKLKTILPRVRKGIVKVFDAKIKNIERYHDAPRLGKFLMHLIGKGTTRETGTYTISDAIEKYERKHVLKRAEDSIYANPEKAKKLGGSLSVKSADGKEIALKKGDSVYISKKLKSNWVEVTYQDSKGNKYTAEIKKSKLSGTFFQHAHRSVSAAVFKKGQVPHIGDIKQGTIGDCYFDAALLSLTRDNPKFIKNMIRDNGDTVTVRFFLPGKDVTKPPQEKFITIEKSLVVNTVGFRSLTGGGKLGISVSWASYVEKAYAVLKGSYPALEGGRSEDVFPVLTGFSANSVSIGTMSGRPESFWSLPMSVMMDPQKFENAIKSKNTFTTLIKGNPDDDHTFVLVFLINAHQAWNLSQTRRTPSRPIVHNHDLPLKV